MNQPVITVEHLVRTFRIRTEKRLLRGLFHPKWKEVRAVDGISFTIHRGEAVAFLGPNGAGKTTTMKMLSGLILPTGGSVDVLGYTPFDRKHDLLRRIGLVMGNKAGLNWDLTARQSFELFRHIYRIEAPVYEQRLQELSALLDVAEHLDTQVRRLSLGERMKCELIGAILHAPDVLFLDEPTIGLDILAKQKIRAFLRELPARLGTTLLLTSHDMDDIEEVCDRVIVINRGTLVHDGPMEALLRKYQTVRYLRLVWDEGVTPPELPHATRIPDDEPGDLYQVPREQLVATMGRIANAPGLLDIQLTSAPLERIIADLFQGKVA